MKTIIYFFIAIFIFGSIATGFTYRAKAKNSILIQATDNGISPALLSQSAKIISGRLKDFSSEKFEITVVPEKNQIQVILTNTWDLKAVKNLLIQKGSLAFYETYNHKALAELLNGNDHLFSLLNNSNANHSGARIGCTPVSEVEKVTNYFNSLGLNQKCKFAWQSSDQANVCLYALKMDSEKWPLMTGADIESVKSNQGKSLKNYEIEITFKKSAITLWADATKRNIGNDIAIVLDDKVLSAPVVRSIIEGGHAEITGDFTENQARYIAALCNNGELPISFKVVE